MSSNVSGPVGPEYLGPEVKQRSTGSKKPTIVAASAVAVLAAAGLGGWGVVSLLGGGGPSPATAVPADAVGYVSIDLDPSASQKIEALQTLKKFPGLAKELKLNSRDDLRRWAFERYQKDGNCTNLDYDKDIAPWIGDRLGFAGVPDRGSVKLEMVVQVSDQAAARKAVSALDKCSGGGKSDVAFAGDYMVMSDPGRAAKFAKAAQRSALQDDPSFQKWTAKVGDPGVVTMYASAEAPKLLMQMEKRNLMHSGLTGAAGPGDAFAQGFHSGFYSGLRQSQKSNKDFKGMAGVLRFHDGAIEAEFVSAGHQIGKAPVADVAHLPSSTAAAFGVGLKPGWQHGYLKKLAPMAGGKAELRRMIAMANRATGLSLPADLVTLLGDGVTLSLDSSADFQALSQSPDTSKLPVGLRIKGNPARITGVVDKVRSALGPRAGALASKSGDGVVAVGLDKQYVDSLAGNGTLGQNPAFTSVVPHADRSPAVFYVNFDAGNGAIDRLFELGSHGDPSVKANIKPLHALGISGWVDGDVSHGLFRLSIN